MDETDRLVQKAKIIEFFDAILIKGCVE